MACIKCGMDKPGISPNLRHLGRLCRGCFLEVIEKRVRKEMRVSKAIRKNDRILVIDDSSKEFAVANFLLSRIIKDLPVKIDVRKSLKNAAKYSKIVVPWALEDECECFMKKVLDSKKQLKPGRKEVKLLANVSEDEIAEFARIKGFRCSKKPKSGIRQVLGKLEKRYPGYKFSLLNSIKQLADIEKQ